MVLGLLIFCVVILCLVTYDILFPIKFHFHKATDIGVFFQNERGIIFVPYQQIQVILKGSKPLGYSTNRIFVPDSHYDEVIRLKERAAKSGNE